MVELRSFIKALKVSWLRKILHQTKPNEWTYLSLINFHTLFSIGGSYEFKLSSELQRKKGGKNQESIQSSTTPEPGYQLESDNVTIIHHKREQPFPSR